ncbi:MAG: thioredoxin-like domain-containing protein [Muribaculaceae bacterium]
MKKHILVLATIALAVCSCGNKNQFSVEGNVEGASEKTLMLESAINGRWFVIDTVRTSSNGDFELSREAPKYPEIYRLTLDGKSVYFPIDSLENIELNSKVSSYGIDYTLSGSDNAIAMMNVDKKARTLQGTSLKDGVVKREAFKRELAEKIIENPSGIVAYYIINKYVGDTPLFDPTNSVDLRIIGAVANAYNSFKPKDPRTAYLVKVLIEGQKMRRAAVAKYDTMYVAETKLFDIKLQDNLGKEHSLRKVTSQGNIVILNFTLYTAEKSPMFNKILIDTYNKNKARGLEIYQVGLDGDLAQWKATAGNLPWITVYDGAGPNSKNLMSYNVTGLPTTFVINRKGELVERITDITTLDATLQKYL